MKLHQLNSIYQIRKRHILEKNLSFPEFIRQLREALGLNMTTVASFCGLSRHKIYRLENGSSCQPPKDERLDKLADLYDVPRHIVLKKFLKHSKKQKDANRNSRKSSS